MALAPDGGSFLPASSVEMSGGSFRFLGVKMTWQTSSVASSPSPVCLTLLVGGIVIVLTLRLELGIGGRLVWLHQFSDGQTIVQNRFAYWHAHEVDFFRIIFDKCVHHCQELGHCGLVSRGP